ncbi:MAG: amidohydrolase family protein [Actinomycetes bacterium]
MHDLVIKNGSVVDGTGAPARIADIAIDGDRVVELGTVKGDGRRVIDAEGCVVTPGFVDIHTHLDAQLAWDPIGTSSCWHGVTSVVLGNCGVTFAPCKESDREELAEMMESVEDIPADSIMSGLAWDWTTYGEYLDAVEKWPKGINVGGMIGHCAVRVHAMGARSMEKEPASAADIEAMCALVDEAISAGALGFSTSRTLLHRVPDGRPVPGTWATADELIAIGEVMGRHGRGVFESAPRVGEGEGADSDYPKTREEVAMMAEISIRSGRPLTFGMAHVNHRDDLHRKVMAFVAEGNARGAHLRPQTTARGIGVLFGLSHTTPFDSMPAWRNLQPLSLEARLEQLRDPAVRKELIEEGGTRPGDDFLSTTFILSDDNLDYRHDPENSLVAEARRRGVSAAEAFIDMSLESNGRILVNYPFLNQSLDAVAEMLADPNVIMGLADAGAHVGQIMDASQPTFFLANWVRERGVFSIEEGVRRLTSDTAGLFNIADRGVLREGCFADVNVIDFENLNVHLPEYVNDFPGGAGRYVQRASGYRATVVNGRVTLENGEHTGDLSGVMLRS